MKKIQLFTVIAISLLSVSCSIGAQSSESGGVVRNFEKSAGFDVGDQEHLSNESLPVEPASSQVSVDRKLVRTGYLLIRSPEYDKAAKDVEQIVVELKGYVEDFTQSENSVRLVCRIPAEEFDSFFSLAGTLGKTIRQNKNVRDVTLEFYDVKSRLETKEILRERLEEYLKSAGNIKDLLEIERELNEVNSEIEQIATRFKVLSQQISYSAVSVEILNSDSPLPEDQLPSWKRGFLGVGRNILGFLYWIVFIVIYILLFGSPIVVVAALFWMITFGRIGLVKKLFRRISRKKD